MMGRVLYLSVLLVTLTVSCYGSAIRTTRLHPPYTIEKVSKHGSYFTLNDGSSWEAGIFSKDKIKKWEEGDEIFISHLPNQFYSRTKARNQTRKESAWITLKHPPDSDNADCLWIKEISFETRLITLCNGAVFKQPYTSALQEGTWQEGDPVTVLKYKQGSDFFPYGLWNHMIKKQIYNLTLIDLPLESSTEKAKTRYHLPPTE